MRKPGPTAPDHPSATIVKTILAHLRAGKTAMAERACADALATDPNDPALNALAAAVALQAQKPAEALDYARQSLSLRADHGPTHVLHGRALRALQRFGEAATAFEAAVRHDPGTPAPAFLLCATRLQARDPRAAAMLDGLLARFPDEAAGWQEIGLVLAELGKPAAALACFSRAMRIVPNFELAMRIGLILKDLGKSAEAAAAFGQAAALDAGSVRAKFLLGLSLQDAGESTAAARAYREALTLDPAQAEAAVNLGTVLQDEGDLDGAKVAYGQALAARPDTFGRIAQAMTTSRRGELWLDLGRLRRVLAG